MFALRLPLDIEQRLDALAKKTGRSKSFYARKAILRHIGDIEDEYLTRRRVKRSGSRVTLEDLEADLKKRSKGLGANERNPSDWWNFPSGLAKLFP